MTKATSCGIVIVNSARELFLCHATGTPRWDLPKGLAEPGESMRQAAIREALEEASLVIKPDDLLDLGSFPYLPSKTLHLFAVRVALNAFRLEDCQCTSTFAHRLTGKPTPEVDAYAWRPRDQLAELCGKNMSRVLTGLDWATIDGLSEISELFVAIA